MKKQVNIFLDDHRSPYEVTWTVIPCGVDWYVAKDYLGFVEALRLVVNLDLDLAHVSFDHDLGWGHGKADHKELNGLHCAQVLVEWCMNTGRPLPAYTVHSMNPVGAENIRSYLESYRRSCE